MAQDTIEHLSVVSWISRPRQPDSAETKTRSLHQFFCMMMMMMMVVVVVMVIAMISCPKPMFAEDLPQRDKPSDLGRKSQLADRITIASNPIWIDRRGLYDDLAIAMPVSDHIPSLRNRNP